MANCLSTITYLFIGATISLLSLQSADKQMDIKGVPEKKNMDKSVAVSGSIYSCVNLEMQFSCAGMATCSLFPFGLWSISIHRT